MSSFKKNKDLELGKRNDVLFVRSTALLATLIILNFVIVNNIIS